jgi:hypothetical protein
MAVDARRRLARLLLLAPGLCLLIAPAMPAAQVRTAADLVGPRNWDSYFPFRLGDSWTYDWKTAGTLAPGGTAVRTRVFDGTSFIGDNVGYKLVADDGAYHLYTYEKGILAIHSSSDARRLLYYEPPVIVAAPDFTAGESRTIAQADGTRQFTTTFAGIQDLTVPLGTFTRVLVMRLSMKGSDYSSEAVHYFAPRVGLIAYQYEVKDAAGEVLMTVDARLRLARLAGADVRTRADLDRLAAESSAVPAAEDRGVREMLKAALAKRYTWPDPFPGFTGAVSIAESGKPAVRGTFEVAPDLSVKVEAADDGARALLRNEISSFITQRKPGEFDVTYAETTFVRRAARPDGAIVIEAAGDPLATIYTIKDGEIVEVSRSVGRLRYIARDRGRLCTDDGRSIATNYDVVYVSNEDGRELSTERTADTYGRVGPVFLPTGRRVERLAPGQPSVVREVRLSDIGLAGR